MTMKKLNVGSRVRYIGGQKTYNNAVLYLLIGRTGVIKSKSTMPGMDWYVEMDMGIIDIDAAEKTLEPIDDEQSDSWMANERELEVV